MRNVPSETYTVLSIDQLTPNPSLPDGEFDPRRLESH
jgi:hypothetical protein